MDLRQLERFVVVAETQTVGSASARLGLSQPALTRSLQLLERTFGQALFYRTSKGVRLTAFGRAMLPQAKLVLRDSARLAELVEAFNGAAGGRVAFGVSPNLEALCAEALVAFGRRRPEVRVRVRVAAFAELAAGLLDGDLDLVLSTVGSEAAPEGLSFEPLLKQILSVVVGSGHPLASREAVTFETLAQQRWVVTDGTAAVEGLRRTFESRGARAPPYSVLCASLSLQKRLVLSGGYVAIMDRALLVEELEAGQAAALRAETDGVELRSGLLYRAEGPPGAAAGALAHAVRSAAAALEPPPKREEFQHRRGGPARADRE